MDRIREGYYPTFVRSDYASLRPEERDSFVRDAVEYYLSLPEDTRNNETVNQRGRNPSEEEWTGNCLMSMEGMHLHDGLMQRMKRCGDPEKSLNCAIRLWLEARGLGKLKP